MRFKKFGGFFKAQGETKRASCAAFTVVLVSLDIRNIFYLVLHWDYEFYTVKVRNHIFKCVFTFDKLFFWQDIGIVIKHRHVKVRGEIFKYAACARSATRMQKKSWLLRGRFGKLHFIFDCAYLGSFVFHIFSIA